MPSSKTGLPAARLTDKVGHGIIVQGEETVLIGGAAKPVACAECKGKALQQAGYPVNVGSGAKILPDETDFALPAPRPLVWQRFYASDTPFVGLLGQGWRTFPEIGIDADATRLRFIDLQGRWIDFRPLAPGDAQHSPSEGLWLARGSADPDETWDEGWQWLPEPYRQDPHNLILTGGDGDYLIFRPASLDPAARSLSRQAPHAAQASPAGNLSGPCELTTLIDRNGYTTHLRWQSLPDGQGGRHRCPVFIEDSAKRIYRLTYQLLDDAQRHRWSAHPRTPGGLSGQSGAGADTGLRLTRLLLLWDPVHGTPPASTVDELCQKTEGTPLVSYRYSPSGDLVEVIDRHGQWTARHAWQHHLMTRLQRPGSREESDDGLDIIYTYDGPTPEARVLRQQQRDGLTLDFSYGPRHTTVTDSLGRQTRYTYEGQGGLRRLTELTGPDGRPQRFAYTGDGLLAETTDAAGHTTRHLYSAQGDALGQVDALGRRQRLDHDPETGLITQFTDTDGGRTQITRNERGHPVTVTGPGGTRTQTRYEAPRLPDRPSTVIDAKGGTKHLTWTPLGQLAAYTDCSGKTTRWHYTLDGDLDLQTDAQGQITRYHRDAHHRLTAIEHPDGTRETYTYDAAGRLAHATDPLGQQITLRYDRFGRLIEQHTQPPGATSAAPAAPATLTAAGTTLRYTYDAAGRLTDLTNSAGRRMRFTYDAADRLIEETGFDGKRTVWTYDAAGRPHTRTEGAGTPEAVTTTYDHDAAGRLIARHLPACDGSPAQTHRFTWDKADRLILADTGTTRTELAWNAPGQLTQETQTTADGHRQTLQYAYDPLGHRTRLTLPDGQTLDTLLYGAGHWHQLAWNGTPLIDVERDDLHRETLRTYGGTTFQRPRPTRRQHYTPRGQLAARSWHDDDRPDSPARERQHYHYRADGLLTGIDETGALDASSPPQPQAPLHRQIRYAYDTQARLEGWRTSDGENDAPGGLAPVTHRYTHDHTGDRLTQLNGVWFTWDGRGNLTRRETEDGTWTYAWNALNQMTACQHTPAGKSEPAWGVGYHYDAFGRRIARTQLDQRAAQRQRDGTIDPYSVRHRLIRSLWDGDRLLQETIPPWRTLAERQEKDVLPSLDQAGALKRTIVYEPGRFEPVAQIVERCAGDESEGSEDSNETAADTRAPRLQFFHTDHLGTPLRLIDSATGDTLWQRAQDPWGNTLSETTAPDFGDDAIPTLRFQGQHYDWETGLHYNRFRYYDPRTHRYVSQDPIGLLGGIHFYNYPTNPVQWVDPLGLDTYVINRDLAAVGNSARSRSNPITHTFTAITDNGGNVHTTYSWGNDANLRGWNRNQPIDIKTAEEALKNGMAERVGDASLDPYVATSFEQLNKKENEHINGIAYFNCKSETKKLLQGAKQIKKNQEELPIPTINNLSIENFFLDHGDDVKMAKILYELSISSTVLAVSTCALYFLLNEHRTYLFLVCGVVFAAISGGYIVKEGLSPDMPFRVVAVLAGGFLSSLTVLVISLAVLIWWRGS